MTDSRISGLYRLSVRERVDALEQQGLLTAGDAELLRQGRQVLAPTAADNIIENVVGVFGLPFAIAPNFIVNGHGYIVPMVVEEPSIVAATSNAARLAVASGGFESHCDESLLAGQIHLTGVADMEAAVQAIDAAKDQLIAAANDVHPRLVARGGGAVDIDVRRIGEILAVHLLVDTRDAMGANLVNTLCEAIAPQIADLCSGDVALRILSNLADRSLVRSRVCYRLQDLAVDGMSAEEVRDGVVTASEIAAADPYRAVTHNKGIMNGVDAIALATGNDWRAIEAGAHAFAAMSGAYAPLATWTTNAGGDLVGELCMPLKVGVVGGTLAANPAAGLALRLTGVESARELAELMGAVGLAQNFAAIRALATEGIQKGHMRMHARSARFAAGRTVVASEPINSGDTTATAAGKLILIGEHAVVYGRHALAIPIPGAVSAAATASDELSIVIPEWNIEEAITDNASPVAAAVTFIMRELDLAGEKFAIRLHSSIPPGMGLGASAALAVAIVRALNDAGNLGLDDARVNAVAFECEKLAHGTPSGVDNTLATYGKPMLFKNDGTLQTNEIELATKLPIIIACSSHGGRTVEQITGVRRRYEQLPDHYDTLFDQMDTLSIAGFTALKEHNLTELGALMNVAHGLLAAIEVSTPELDSMVSIARAAGAAGAKLTGAGGGGSIVALCPDSKDQVDHALRAAGFRTISISN